MGEKNKRATPPLYVSIPYKIKYSKCINTPEISQIYSEKIG